MKLRPVVLAFLLVSSIPVFACKCAAPPTNIANTRLAYVQWRLQGADVVFEGKVENTETKDWPIKPEPGARVLVHPAVLVTFANVRQYRGSQRRQFIVHTGLGGGDCGYDFRVGKSYLVMADINHSGELETGICSGTSELQKSGAALRLLRDEPPAPEDVIDLQNEPDRQADTSYAKICGKLSFPAGVKPQVMQMRIFPSDAANFQFDETESKSDGSFCFTYLETGKYLVGAFEEEPQTARSRLVGYYPGVSQLVQAQPIEVLPGNSSVHANLTLLHEPLYSVRGYLRGVPRSLAESLQIVLMPDGMEVFHAVEPANLDPNGVFEFNSVPPGKYTAYAFVQGDDDESMTFLSSVVQVEIRANIDDLKLEYVPSK